jgi:hypothetical protein
MLRHPDVAVLIACLLAGAVVAIPRHARLGADARVAEVSALAQGVGVAARLAHVRWRVTGQPPVLEGERGQVAMTNGYPSAATLALLLGAAETTGFVHEAGAWRHAGQRRAGNCGVLYQPPAVMGQEPVVRADTSGC